MIAKPLCRHRRELPADNNYIVIRILVKNNLAATKRESRQSLDQVLANSDSRDIS